MQSTHCTYSYNFVMKNFSHRIISASLSPNTQWEDVKEALYMLFSFWKWKKGSAEIDVKRWFSKTYFTDTVATFNSGRSALFGLLHAYGIGKGDEVIVQAFTCVAVPNCVLWAGATPVYADIDATYNIDPKDVEKKITNHTKAIIIQHTFGIPAQIKKLCDIAKKHNLYVIEDCAHGLGATYNNKPVGLFGDAAFFSFGRDKSLSSVWGGVAIMHTPTKQQKDALNDFHAAAPMPSAFWIIQQLFHPIAFAIILPVYTMGIGKAILVGLQKLNLLSYPVYPQEKYGERPKDFPGKYPNALASLVRIQLRKLDVYTKNRTSVAEQYMHNLPSSLFRIPLTIVSGAAYLRYPVLVDDPARIIKYAKTRGILLGNWYHNVIDPTGVVFANIGYIKGSCPQSESAARFIVNLPTRISNKESASIIECLRSCR